MRRKFIVFPLFALLCLDLPGGSRSILADSPSASQFLGPYRNGLIPARGLISSWPQDGPKVVWRAEGGVGMSGVAVAGQLAVTLWNSERGQVLSALQLQDGAQRWSTRLAPSYENGMGNGPRATPTIDGDHVFAYTGEGILACVNLSDGEMVWSTAVTGKYGGKPAEYGMASSPLVVGDLVVVTAGGNGQAVIALAKANGELRWRAGNGTAGYSSPVLLELAGEPQVVAFTGRGVTGIRPKDGKILWEYPFPTPYDCNIANPIRVDGNLFISAGENHGCVMLEVTRQGTDYTVREVWESVNVKSVMRNEWQTSVALNGYLYGFDNVGSAGPVTHLTCVDAKTGETKWRKNRFGKGNLVAADGKLWITTMEGYFVLVEATPNRFIELGRQKLFKKTRQAASIAQGYALIRDDAEVICIKID